VLEAIEPGGRMSKGIGADVSGNGSGVGSVGFSMFGGVGGGGGGVDSGLDTEFSGLDAEEMEEKYGDLGLDLD